MPVPANKEELLKAIETNYSKLKKELETISVEETAVKELDGHAKGTLISIDNLLAYLIGWGELVLKWNKNRSENKPVDFPETGYKWNELGKLAQKFYADYQNDDFNTLIQKLDDTVKKLRPLLKVKQ